MNFPMQKNKRGLFLDIVYTCIIRTLDIVFRWFSVYTENTLWSIVGFLLSSETGCPVEDHGLWPRKNLVCWTTVRKVTVHWILIPPPNNFGMEPRCSENITGKSMLLIGLVGSGRVGSVHAMVFCIKLQAAFYLSLKVHIYSGRRQRRIQTGIRGTHPFRMWRHADIQRGISSGTISQNSTCRKHRRFKQIRQRTA